MTRSLSVPRTWTVRPLLIIELMSVMESWVHTVQSRSEQASTALLESSFMAPSVLTLSLSTMT